MVNLKNQPLILASSSIYRRDLLARLGLPFEAISPEVDECALPNEGVAAMVLRLAVAKATAIAKDRPNAWVIGSDQAADLHGEAIGKPGNFDNALLQFVAFFLPLGFVGHRISVKRIAALDHFDAQRHILRCANLDGQTKAV